MEQRKKVYTPPAAELICLAPSESLAAWDWGFGTNSWKNSWTEGAFTKGVVSAVGIINGVEGETLPSIWDTDDGFVIKK